ncbi:MAG: HlyD family type I secretion periplasmic adaptor subunit [Caulobacteraceae bacterium]|nr:HlyD family type I secretion periplasmic adaptor subunit [Caulobacteraceae bacterium]
MSFSQSVERALAVFEPRDEREFLPAALEVVETPASPTLRLSAWLIIGFFAIAVAWAFLGQIDVHATAEGRILPAGDVKTIQSLNSGIVQSINVQDGDHVRAGQVLVGLDRTDAWADQGKSGRDLIQAELDVARLTSLKAAFVGGSTEFVPPPGAPPELVDQARAALRAQAGEEGAKMGELSQQIAQRSAEVAEVAAQSQKIEATLPMLEQKERMNQQLVARGFGTTFASLDAQQAVTDAKNDLAITSRRADEARAERASLQHQRDEVRSTYETGVLADLAKAQEQVNELSADFAKARNKTAQTEIRSPVDGRVEQVALHTVNGVVMPAERLMIIVPDTHDLTVEARIANRDVGFVRPGQKVKVKIETFNFTRYGMVEGRVLSVSPDVVDADTTPASASASGAATSAKSGGSPAYIARIALGATSMMVDGVRRPLQPGMSVTAEIRTGGRSIADYLLSPLARKTQDSLHER